VGFTAHHVVAAGVGAEEVAAALPTDDLGAAMDARFLAWLGERLGTPPGMIDAVLAADAVSGPAAVALRPVSSQVSNARVQRASRYRRDLRVFKDDAASAFVTLGRGLAGRLEVSIEVEPDRRDAGFGRTLAEAARTLCPPDEPVFAQVTPGNARSLRAFLAAGFRPIGSEVLFLRARPSGSAGP
jgi:GNAT superfamily N-acetyltransferase